MRLTGLVCFYMEESMLLLGIPESGVRGMPIIKSRSMTGLE
jgi:hypothetical protein